MLKSLGILLIAAVILWIEVPPLLKKKQKKNCLCSPLFWLLESYYVLLLLLENLFQIRSNSLHLFLNQSMIYCLVFKINRANEVKWL